MAAAAAAAAAASTVCVPARSSERVVSRFAPEPVAAAAQSSLSSRVCLPSRPQAQRLRFRRRRSPRAAAAEGNGKPENSNGDSAQENDPLQQRREILLDYVKTVQPDLLEAFSKRAPQTVVDAMRQTVSNMIGSLPPRFFEVTVTTVAENLAQLMYSVLMTGYMFRNAQYRMELRQSLALLPAPGDAVPSELEVVPKYAPGSQKRVQGEVLRWSITDDKVESMGARDYIDMLESEVAALQAQLEAARKEQTGDNPLLSYLKRLEPKNLQELTTSAGPDVLEAMNSFIKRLLNVNDTSDLKSAISSSSAAEMAQLVYWLLVVGYNVRTLEVRLDMESKLGLPMPASRQFMELPPGDGLN
eukprot:jgi/Chlat1/6970/Chrsp52S06620